MDFYPCCAMPLGEIVDPRGAQWLLSQIKVFCQGTKESLSVHVVSFFKPKSLHFEQILESQFSLTPD
jgi:hypothetical protein